ncbi:rCG44655 [Rattus norvegicus]|uniref:RCG44655 n=1 Tax=Rattus norvegicus TaxID=10116 RepID=A6I5C1_RAT|nr:rCG44655 [Rattus norvegicus]
MLGSHQKVGRGREQEGTSSMTPQYWVSRLSLRKL